MYEHNCLWQTQTECTQLSSSRLWPVYFSLTLWFYLCFVDKIQLHSVLTSVKFYLLSRGGSGRVQQIFTQALWLILALLNPILFCERGALSPPGMWRWRLKPACRPRTQRAGQFFILIARDTSKVAERRPRRDRRREREGGKVRKMQLRWSQRSICPLPLSVLQSPVSIFSTKTKRFGGVH